MALENLTEWMEANKDDLLVNIEKALEKINNEITKKEEEREVLRLMRDMVNTTK